MPQREVRRLLIAAVACLALLSLPPVTAADNDSKPEKPAERVLRGVVLDAQDQPVAAARVYWQAADGSGPHFLRTDAAGRFRSKPVRPGLYDIRAQSEGLWSGWQRNVLVRPTAGAEVTLRLVRDTPPDRPK